MRLLPISDRLITSSMMLRLLLIWVSCGITFFDFDFDKCDIEMTICDLHL